MKKKQLFGVIHLPPLDRPIEKLVKLAVEEAKIFEKAGFEAVVIENFGSKPFFKAEIPTEDLVAVTLIAQAVRNSVKCKVGLNLLRNAALQSLTVATILGLDFIRVNILSGAYATDQGLIEGCAAELARLKKRLNSKVKIYADVWVKHAEPLMAGQSLDLAIEEVVDRGGADAVILSGETTGRAVDFEELDFASAVTRKLNVPLFVGSGLSLENVKEVFKCADGAFVSSSLRAQGKPGAKLNFLACKKLTKKCS